MAGSFAINTAALPGVNQVSLHDSRGRTITLTTTPAKPLDQYQAQAIKAAQRAGLAVATES